MVTHHPAMTIHTCIDIACQVAFGLGIDDVIKVFLVVLSGLE